MRDKMRILAIIGSPRKKSNSYALTRRVEEQMKLLGDVEFEYLWLRDANLEPCRGCYVCLDKGEQFCPIKGDDRPEIEARMEKADGVVFVSPVYVYNVSWLMKAFVDRFAYVCHRPRFHGKPAMAIATTGAVGLNLVLWLLSFPPTSWGFHVVHKLGARTPASPEHTTERQRRRTAKHVERAVRTFYRAVESANPPSPGWIQVVAFALQKHAFSQAAPESADYRYWREKGWLEPDARFYTKARTSLLGRVLAGLIARIMLAF